MNQINGQLFFSDKPCINPPWLWFSAINVSFLIVFTKIHTQLSAFLDKSNKRSWRRGGGRGNWPFFIGCDAFLRPNWNVSDVKSRRNGRKFLLVFFLFLLGAPFSFSERDEAAFAQLSSYRLWIIDSAAQLVEKENLSSFSLSLSLSLSISISIFFWYY